MSYFHYQHKRIYFSELGIGKGVPLLFLHGNTASSKMFVPLLPLYQKDFRVILLDFLGHGKSDRIPYFPAELWLEEARQVIALLESLPYEKVHLIGTSGGAWVALNAALERPDLFASVTADSFDGRTLAEDFADKLLAERTSAKADVYASQFYQWCQGNDWETIVDCDTKALLQCASQRLPLFHQPLYKLQTPLLLMGSLQDTTIRSNLAEEYAEIAAEVPHTQIHLFAQGGHPALLSNAEPAAAIIGQFLAHIK